MHSVLLFIEVPKYSCSLNTHTVFWTKKATRPLADDSTLKKSGHCATVLLGRWGNLRAVFGGQCRLLWLVLLTLHSAFLDLWSYPEMQSVTWSMLHLWFCSVNTGFISGICFPLGSTWGTHFCYGFWKMKLHAKLLNLHILHMLPLLQINLPGVTCSFLSKGNVVVIFLWYHF